MIYFLWMSILTVEMLTYPYFYENNHKKFLIFNLLTSYSATFINEYFILPFQVYSIWFFLWTIFPCFCADIHHFFNITEDKFNITANRASVICHIFGCFILGLLNIIKGGYDNVLFWYSLFYFYNDIFYILIYDLKILHLIHHIIAIGCFYLWTLYPIYGKDCLEVLLILEKGNLLHSIWDWARNVGIKPKLSFCKYMTYHYILVRVGYLSWKVYTFIPRLYGDESVNIYHRYIGIMFTFLIYFGSLLWSNKLYLGYQKLVYKTNLERSKIMVDKSEQIDKEELPKIQRSKSE